MNQTILVTGASSGFGLLIANKLHQNGYHVIGTSRNPQKYQAKLPFKLLALDIADDDSIDSFDAELFSQVKRLDVLVNNAGYLVTGLAEETAVEIGKQQFETNFWGTVKLTNKLLPYFRKQKHGKIITVGSLLGLVSLPNVAYYAASKHALEGYFKALRLELNQFNIQVSMVEPSSFKTNIGISANITKGDISDYDAFRQKINAYTKTQFIDAPGPDPVINTVLKIVNEKTPRYSYPVGKGSSMILTMQRFAYSVLEKSILKSINAAKWPNTKNTIMKRLILITFLIMTIINTSFAQSYAANKDTKTYSGITFQNVKTQTVNVGGTDFYYRKLGENNSGIPVIFLNHLAATMDNCDPRIIDGIASQHQVICFDNRGVGATRGKTPKTVAEMAKDARAFIHSLGYEKVDLVGFSLGGFISQEILLQEPQLVRKAIITGTGPAGGVGIKKVTGITYLDIMRGLFSFKDAKTYLFFSRNTTGKKAAKEFLGRLKERKDDRDKKMKIGNFQRQLKAIHAWGLQAPQDLSVIKQPVLVANGDNDRMVPSSNTTDLNKRLSNSEMIIYKDAGHGGIFQYHNEFVNSALSFLAK